MRVEFDFHLQQRVTILALDLPGIVTACLIGPDGKEYRVVYWSDGSRKSEWLLPFELGKE